jgi:hypothetical protein
MRVTLTAVSRYTTRDVFYSQTYRCLGWCCQLTLNLAKTSAAECRLLATVNMDYLANVCPSGMDAACGTGASRKMKNRGGPGRRSPSAGERLWPQATRSVDSPLVSIEQQTSLA